MSKMTNTIDRIELLRADFREIVFYNMKHGIEDGTATTPLLDRNVENLMRLMGANLNDDGLKSDLRLAQGQRWTGVTKAGRELFTAIALGEVRESDVTEHDLWLPVPRGRSRYSVPVWRAWRTEAKARRAETSQMVKEAKKADKTAKDVDKAVSEHEKRGRYSVKDVLARA